MRISDWSSDVCSSDLGRRHAAAHPFSEHSQRLSGGWRAGRENRSEEHTSELQSLMRISYAVFCLKKKNTQKKKYQHTITTLHSTMCKMSHLKIQNRRQTISDEIHQQTRNKRE